MTSDESEGRGRIPLEEWTALVPVGNVPPGWGETHNPFFPPMGCSLTPAPRLHHVRYSAAARAWLVYDPHYGVKASCLTEASAAAAKRLLDS